MTVRRLERKNCRRGGLLPALSGRPIIDRRMDRAITMPTAGQPLDAVRAKRSRPCRLGIASVGIALAMAVCTPLGNLRAQGYAPLEAARHMTVAEGFEVQLVAAEPLVRQPVAIEFDDRGRLVGRPVSAVSKSGRARSGSRSIATRAPFTTRCPSRRHAARGGTTGSRSWTIQTATAGPTGQKISSPA